MSAEEAAQFEASLIDSTSNSTLPSPPPLPSLPPTPPTATPEPGLNAI